MAFSTLSEWLTWIASIHPSEIKLGLERVKRVAKRLSLLSPQSQVIIVGGTNGKGSTVAGLEAIYLSAHYQVGTFTSPFLFKHNEEVHLNGKPATDDAFCAAFAAIEAARGKVLLTPFEFHTLAALYLLQKQPLDVLILEVGLGGRLDAVNIIDADLAIVTSIDLDHMEWLGKTREAIAYEKAGIFRANHPALCGDQNPPASLLTYAKDIQAALFCQGRDFSYEDHGLTWSFSSPFKNTVYQHLPKPKLALQNMATVLMAITILQAQLPITRKAIDEGLAKVFLPGRIQIIENAVTEIFDVSHNPAAVAFLAKKLQSMPCIGKTHAVFSMLADKDILGSIYAIKNLIDRWHLSSLPVKRGATKDVLLKHFKEASISHLTWYRSIQEAYEGAKKHCHAGDRIIVFGSFHTVSSAHHPSLPSP